MTRKLTDRDRIAIAIVVTQTAMEAITTVADTVQIDAKRLAPNVVTPELIEYAIELIEELP